MAKSDSWELYDLKNDPQELNNVYRNPEYAAVIKKLEGEIDRLQKELDEPAQ